MEKRQSWMAQLVTGLFTQSKCQMKLGEINIAPSAPVNKANQSTSDTVDMFGMVGDLAFISQQLVWEMKQNQTALDKLGAMSRVVARETENNASSTQETAAGIQEIAASAGVVSNSSREVLAQCRTSLELTLRSQQEFIKMTNNMTEVAQVVERAARSVEDLNAASQHISEFTNKIQRIASQTNLLALNAAIEAARAGEHGRGFAVVAQEVRTLAGESAQITQEVDMVVGDITRQTKQVTANMLSGRDKLAGMESIACQSAQAMQVIVDNINGIGNTVEQLCQLSETQNLTTEQMAVAIGVIGSATVEIASNTQAIQDNIDLQQKSLTQVFDHAKTITGMADKLQAVAVRFKSTEDIVFGACPFTTPQFIRETWVPILENVAKKIGLRARMVIVSDYDALGRAVFDGIVDIGWFSPFAYVSARQMGKLVPLVTPIVNNSASYKGYIITSKEKGYTGLNALEGKKFAFVDRQSASGYVYPRALLAKSGKNPETFFGETVFLGSHNRVIDGVLEGMVDGGATYSEAIDAARGKGYPVEQLVILAQTESIPKDAIACRPEIPLELSGRLQQAFLEMTDKDKCCAALLTRAGINGFTIASDQAYDVIRKLAT